MKRFLILLFTIHCSLFTIHCSLFTLSAQQTADVRRQISQAAASLKSMQCDFVQTKQLRLLNDRLVSRGKMYYQQGNRLRWEYLSPYTYSFILNGQKVLLKNSRRQDVIDTSQNKLFGEIARIMMKSVTGQSLTDDRDFKTTIATTPSEWVATLVPQRKDMRQMFQQIILHVSRKQSMVTQVELVEKKGDRTIIELKNVKVNETLPATLFVLD